MDVNSKTEADLKVEAKQNGTDIVISAPTATKPEGEVPVEQPVDEDWDK